MTDLRGVLAEMRRALDPWGGDPNDDVADRALDALTAVLALADEAERTARAGLGGVGDARLRAANADALGLEVE